MEQAEIEENVKELETRLDRLRSLYEQYFMGIEKIEPNVPRKDVERRFQTLRREQIRNTALRFRFHMVLQRYNTYQAYWMRICRQIEEGTYKRDLRAKVRGVAEGAGAPRRRRRRGADETDEAPEVDAVEESFDIAFSIPPEPMPAAAAPPPLPKIARPPALPTFGGPPKPPVPVAAPVPAPVAGPAGKPPVPALLQEKMRLLAAQIAAKKPMGAPPPAPPRPPLGAPPVAPPTITAKKEESATASLRATPPSVPPPPPARPAARPAPRPAPPPAPKVERAPGELSDERVRQLYTQFVDTKRKQQESTAAVTFDGLAKTLRESTAKLKEKHTGKSVDFEVTVKDGKTILRPIVK